jgi:hypothetical protein
VAKKPPTSDDVKTLLDRFCRRAPEEARAIARQAGESATEAWRTYWRPWEGLASPATRAALAGGLLLFAAGWLVGRKVRTSRRNAALVAAAVAGGVAAGALIAAHSTATLREPGGRPQETREPPSA